ncbi:MAG: hypothetical protein QOK23_3078 [Gammaproteobacteria bacterium]|jgi:hypothetical protein|nr:hypothetical protein [Gammaproteobacteria bacterium]
MIDTEVVRLRNLRNVALRARAFARVLGKPTADGAVFARSAVICWTIARIATGRLRAHPYLSYQQGPSRLRDLVDRSMASVVAFGARRSGRSATVYIEELQRVARAVDDARALTWSAEFSDALGRTQVQLRRLTQELDGRAQHESGTVREFQVEVTAAALQEIAVESNWPYLAI